MPSPVSTTAKLTYLVAPDAGVRAYFTINADPITGVQKRNTERQEHEVTLENVRGKEAEYTLDNCGFQFSKHKSSHTTFLNDDDVVKEYYPESVDLIKKLTGASRVELFDHSELRLSSEFMDVIEMVHCQPFVVAVQAKPMTPQVVASLCHRYMLTRPPPLP